jgi:hypothetical protein
MPHDYGLFTNNKSKIENRPRLTEIEHESIKENMDFILSHFRNQHELFPRTIITNELKAQRRIDHDSDEQIIVQNIFKYFKQSDFVDCRINAFPFNNSYTRIGFDVKNRCAANFIMIDLDLEHFENNEEKLDEHLSKVLKKTSLTFNGEAHPTVLWTGNGYHIYQPVNGIVFEQIQAFYDFLPYLDGKDLTTEFIRFAEKFLSGGKADSKHLPSINSCLIRIPGTTNSKNGERVKMVQKWDGFAPNIRYIASDFFDYLIDKRNKNIRERKRQKELRSRFNYSSNRYGISNTQRIEWIEKLLQTPLSDHRKYCIFHILVPYLLNIRKISVEECTKLLDLWVSRCNKIRPVDFNPSIEIKNRIKYVKDFKPMSLSKLQTVNLELYRLIN